jgi:photosystem II stability/assembly factor-like uncharacterized protein
VFFGLFFKFSFLCYNESMRKYLITIVSAAVLMIVFSGCSLLPAKNPVKKVEFTFSQSLWKSADGGIKWEAKNKGEGKANIKDMNVLSLAVNPSNGNNVFAGLRKGGILRTDNGGETWQFVNFQSEKVYGLEMEPINGKTLYASGVWEKRGKIFKTEDNGENWKELYTSSTDGPLVISLTVDKKNPSVIYATTSSNDAIKSMDGGMSWKNIYLSDSPILKISVDAVDSNLVYFITNNGQVYRSFDGGKKFENIDDKIFASSADFDTRGFAVLKIDPNRAKHVYLAGESGIALSRDAGENWERINSLNDPNSFPIRDIAISPFDSESMVYVSGQAAYKSTDGGVNWTTFQFNLEKTARIIMFNPSDRNVVYLGFDAK